MKLLCACGLLLIALVVQESSCVVWESKESPSGVRGRGQITPQLFDINAGKQLHQQLQDISSQVTDKEHSRSKRQADNIGYTARLGNDSHLQAVVHWTGHPSQYIFIVTRKLSGSHSIESWLWRSTDYGHTFVNETHKLSEIAANPIVEWYYISPYSQYLIFADTQNSMLYVTIDEGDSYHAYPCPFTPDRILFQSVLAPNSSDTPYNNYVLGYNSTGQSLWVSPDLGASWTHLSDNVPAGRYYWRRLGADIEGDLSTVYFEQMTEANSNYSMLYKWNINMPHIELFSRDLGQFESRSFVLEYEYMFVQKPDTANAQSNLSPLWVSHQRGTSFTQASFPLVTGEQHYSVIDASEGQVFIAVYHSDNTSNLYISEEMGVDYSLSLEFILSPPVSDWIGGNPTIDVHVVEGVVGTYFANRHVVGSNFGSTVVSFDKGGMWSQLSPPALDYLGRPIVCAPPDCSLHLHMDIDAENNRYQSILSQDSAIGLIMAQGNLGSTLSSSTRNLRLYFSRDGGFTWAEVRSGVWEFQFAALGSIVVAVRKRRLTSSVLWTCDEGATWSTTTIVDSSFPRGIVIIGVRTEIGEKSNHVTVFGYDIFQGGFQEWLVVDVNFTSVVPRQCNPEEDYFDWIPTDERPESRCLLGEVVTYERRNSSACCYVDPQYEKSTNRSLCTCAIEDFECDFGFERETLNSPCNPLPGLIYPFPPPSDCPEGGNYTYTSGYRKIAGDKCVPGQETYFYPITRPCPILAPRILIITYTPQPIKAGANVNFTLSQYLGGKISTVYEWGFNDSTPDVQVTGFDSAQFQSHTFARPGVYNVHVSASNDGGVSDISLPVTVLDTLLSVSITPPPQLFEEEVPTSIVLVFNATVTSVYGTDVLSIYGYSWDFGDNNGQALSGKSTASHTYTTAGRYTVTVNVHVPFYTKNQASYSFVVYEAAPLVDITSNDTSSVIVRDGATYVLANRPIKFYSQAKGSDSEIIPPDTQYSWHVISLRGAPTNINISTQTLSYSFHEWGDYRISVIGRSEHSSANFVGELTLTAEYVITGLTISHLPTVRTGVVVTFQVSTIGEATYKGPATVTIKHNNGTELGSRGTSNEGTTQLSIEVKGRGVTQFIFNVENHVSSVDVPNTIIVVDSLDYGEISIQFSTFPSKYNNTDWQERLKSSVIDAIVKLHSMPRELIEIEAIRVVEQNISSSSLPDSLKSHSILKRASGTTLFLYVDVNILPAAYNQTSIDLSKSIAKEIVDNARNKTTFLITVDGDSLTISSAHERTTGGTIIEPPIVSVIVDSTKYAIIGGALGVFIVLAVIITTVLIVVVYFYRRKYTRLNVRYSRLQQTPVRFTFTPGGEMVEEDDFEYDEDEDEDNIKMRPT